jgi:ferredoxin
VCYFLAEEWWRLDNETRQQMSRWIADGMAGKRCWSLLGRRVCLPVWVRILGTSARWVRKAVQEIPDLRTQRANLRSLPKPTPQGDRCDRFFRQLYMSAAEPLPEDGARIAKKRRRGAGAGSMVDADITYDDKPWLFAGDTLHPDDDEGDEDPGAVPKDWNPDFPAIDSMCALALAGESCVVGLPRRYLPHGCTKGLYWMFTAEEDLRREAEALDADRGSESRVPGAMPQYTTFWRRWAKVRSSRDKVHQNRVYEVELGPHRKQEHRLRWRVGTAFSAAAAAAAAGVRRAPSCRRRGACCRCRVECGAAPSAQPALIISSQLDLACAVLVRRSCELRRRCGASTCAFAKPPNTVSATRAGRCSRMCTMVHCRLTIGCSRLKLCDSTTAMPISTGASTGR